MYNYEIFSETGIYNICKKKKKGLPLSHKSIYNGIQL